MAAVSAAVGAGTLPALLKQATPTEEAIARVALPAPPPPAPVAAAQLAVPMQLAAAPAAPPATEPAIVPPQAAVVASIPTPAEPTAAMAQAEPPPAATAPPAPPASSSAAGATPGPFPPVQPLTMDENVRPPAEQAARPDVPAAAASLPSRNAGKPAWRKRVASSRKTRWRYARPRPFSIRQFLASLHLR